MNSRGLLILRMLIEFIVGLIFMIAAVDVERVHLFNNVWVDVPCRLLLAIFAFGILVDAFRLRRDTLAR
jgi:hypothetical protein